MINKLKADVAYNLCVHTSAQVFDCRNFPVFAIDIVVSVVGVVGVGVVGVVVVVVVVVVVIVLVVNKSKTYVFCCCSKWGGE